jgi:hypothetical protein
MDWVFFDCFNTLIDDFDSQGTIDGLETIAYLPLDAGVFDTAVAFREAGREARAVNWWRPESEVHLAVRPPPINRPRLAECLTKCHCRIENTRLYRQIGNRLKTIDRPLGIEIVD